jgi:FixJ family two-component response regulator
MFRDNPTVFTVDHDAHAAKQRLMKTLGLHSKPFAMPEDFLWQLLPNGSICLRF